jgi:hypothetical protein
MAVPSPQDHNRQAQNCDHCENQTPDVQRIIRPTSVRVATSLPDIPASANRFRLGIDRCAADGWSNSHDRYAINSAVWLMIQMKTPPLTLPQPHTDHRSTMQLSAR